MNEVVRKLQRSRVAARVSAVIAITAISAAVLTGCSPARPITLNGIEVDGPNEALELMDATFAQIIDNARTDHAVSVPEESRCYFQAADNDVLASTAVCGPVWDLGNDAPHWHLLNLGISAEGVVSHEYGNGLAASPEADKTPYRTDGKEYDADLAIAEPDAPNSLKPGVVKEWPMSAIAQASYSSKWAVVNNKDAVAVATPDFSFEVTEVKRSDRVGASDNRTATDEGYEFVSVGLLAKSWIVDNESEAVEGVFPELSLTVDGEEFPVESFDPVAVVSDPMASTPISFVATIPKDAKALSLGVTYEGVTQDVDLADHSRGDVGQASGYYDGLQYEVGNYLSDDRDNGWDGGTGFDTTIFAGIDTADRTPFADGRWASDGNVFLDVNMNTRFGWTWYNIDDQPTDEYDVTATAPAITATDSDGKAYEASSAALDEDGNIHLIFEVPVGTPAVTLSGSVEANMVRASNFIPGSPATGSETLQIPEFELRYDFE